MYYYEQCSSGRSGSLLSSQFERLEQVPGIAMIDQALLDKPGEFYAAFRASGQSIEGADLLIAATALVDGMILVTYDTAHLVRLTGLQVEAWLMS